MKRFLSISLLSLTLLFGVGTFAHAQDADAQPGGFYGVGTSAADLDDQAMGQAMTGANAPAPTDSAAANTPTNNLGPTVPTQYTFNSVLAYIAQLFAWLLGVAAILLDNTVYYTVVKMGAYVNDLSAVGVVWSVMRDFGNIVLIFGFLAIGIMTILNTTAYGWERKALPMLLVAAVFLNFSLFISEAVIDTGNLFATQFYTQINGGLPAGGKELTLSQINNEGISNRVMSSVGLQTIYGEVSDPAKAAEFLKHSGTIGFMSIFLFIVAAFVFFALAFVLISRFVILLYLIVISPIAFAGWAVPKLESVSKDWLNRLLTQTITAPVLLMLLYIALAVITDNRFLAGFGSTSPSYLGYLDKNLMGFASVLLSFIVAMGLLLFVVIASKKLSAFGGDWASKWAGRASFGLAAYGASGVFGGTARGLRAGLQRYVPTSRVGQLLHRGASHSLRFVEKKKFDVRSLPGVTDAAKKFGLDQAAVPLGESTVGRARQAYEWVRTPGEYRKGYDQEMRLPRLEAAIRSNNAGDMGRILGNISDKDLESGQMQRILSTHPAAAATLSQARFDKLMSSDALSDTQKNTLRTQRRAGVRARYANAPHPDPRFGGRTVADVTLNGAPAGPGGVPPAAGGLSTSQRAELDSDILVQPHVMSLLTAADFNAIFRRGHISGPDLGTMSTYLRGLIPPAGPPPTPLGAQIAALAGSNRAFAAFFGLP